MHEWAGGLSGALVSAADSLDTEFEERLRDSGTLAFRVAFSVLRHRQDARRRADEVEIIIDPALDRVVRRLLCDTSRQAADGAPVVPEAAPPADLAVAPMVVEDLPIPLITVAEARSLSK